MPTAAGFFNYSNFVHVGLLLRFAFAVANIALANSLLNGLTSSQQYTPSTKLHLASIP